MASIGHAKLDDSEADEYRPSTQSALGNRPSFAHFLWHTGWYDRTVIRTATTNLARRSQRLRLQAFRWYALGGALVACTHLAIARFGDFLGPAGYMIFIAAVFVTAFVGGYGPSLLVTALSALDLAYFYLPPYRSFRVDFEGFIFLCAFLIVALLTSTLQTRRKQAEESLREARDELEARVRERTAELARSQAQLSVLVNGVADQAFFTLDREGVITSWNAGAERLLRYDAADIVGHPVSQVLPSVVIGRPAASEEQDWAVRRDGTRLWATLVLTPMTAPPGYAVALRDITERRSLERDILEISEREQERIGRDLHDGLGQELTGIAMLSTALAERVGHDRSADAEQVAELVHESIRHTRELARGLCPVNLEDDGLAAALELLCQRIDRLPDVHCRFVQSGDPSDAADAAAPGETVATHLYRIAQEATTNAIRHGRARHIDVCLTSAGQTLSLSVTDDGVGIAAGNGPGGMGIRLMQYRAKMCRGSLNILARQDGGTVVECVLQSTGVPV